ncbi:MAG TPA: hypothetical protein VG694_01125, partial [Candidatus Paceibacterota bacterium]|nr:hypothetical protein [Candidatus Paceibacterota bacterium]
EITLRFIFKVLAVLLVVLFVGVYYIFVLQGRKKFGGFFSVGPWSAIKSVIWVALVVWFAFSVMGSPFKQRLLQLDQRRLNDLQNIQSQVIYYWQQKQSLPAQLSDLVSPLTGYSLPVDPEFEQGKTYEYSVKDAKALKFELCADFDLPMPKGWVENPSYGGGVAVPMAGSPDVISYPYPGPGGTNESWDHQAGRTCYERTIDKDLYPPYPKPAAQ